MLFLIIIILILAYRMSTSRNILFSHGIITSEDEEEEIDPGLITSEDEEEDIDPGLITSDYLCPASSLQIDPRMCPFCVYIALITHLFASLSFIFF